MFTGIVEELGKISSIEKHAGGAKIKIAAKVVTDGTKDGDSIAVNGVCLTALNVEKRSFTADVSQETLKRSTLGSLKTGSPVNLERAVTPSTRLGGHIVQGHVDGLGVVERTARRDDATILDVRVPDDIDELLVPRGSIAVDGVSLTVVELPAPNLMRLSIIDHTLRHTTLGSLGVGSRVHLEGDILAKQLKRLAAPLLKR